MPEDALIKALAQASDSLLAAYPDGAVLIHDQGRVIANHAKGGEMAEIITAEVARFSPGMPRRRLREKRQASSERFGEGARFEVAAVPLEGVGEVLLLGRVQSLEQKMIAALIESRARYKVFVEISSDFAWETGPDGTLICVSPTGALDFTPSQLIGRPPEEIFEVAEPDPSLFKSTRPVRGLAIRMRRADSDMADLVVSINPVFGAALIWRRDGVWRDEDRKRIAIERLLHHERILTLSRTDEPTGLMNRCAFMNEEIPCRLCRLQQDAKPAALMFLDLDNFKVANDAHGHGEGDLVLIEIARFLGKHSRSGDLVARLGGDEFSMWSDDMDQAGGGARRAHAG